MGKHQVNPRLDNRSGDQAVSDEAWASTPQQVDGGVLNESAVAPVGPRPRKRAAVRRREDPSILDSRGEQETASEDAYKATPQQVDGPEVSLEAVKPRG